MCLSLTILTKIKKFPNFWELLFFYTITNIKTDKRINVPSKYIELTTIPAMAKPLPSSFVLLTWDNPKIERISPAKDIRPNRLKKQPIILRIKPVWQSEFFVLE